MTVRQDPTAVPDLAEAIREEDVVALTRRLVAAPSVTGAERDVALILAEELRALGADVVTEEFQPGRLNVYGRLPGPDDGPVILLAGHTDTVNVRGWAQAWPADDGRSDPFGGAVVDGRLWGRGAADMKGGIAASIAAVAGLLRAGARLGAEVQFAFVGDEESGEPGSGTSAGVKAYVRWLAVSSLRVPSFALYAEPTGLDVFPGHLGFTIGVVRVRGRGAYFSFPWRGRSAIRDAHALLTELFAHDADVWDRGRHDLLGRGGLLVTGIHGGESVSVPETCEISFIRWLLPGEDIEVVGAELRDLVRRKAVEQGIDAELSFVAPRNSPVGGAPFLIDLADCPEAELFLACVRDHVPGAKVAGGPWWSEGPVLAELGIRTVYFGAGDISLCHTPQENVPVGDLVVAARAIGSFLLRIAPEPGHEERR